MTREERVASRREQERAEMLKEALSRPGVREVMEVYGGWREQDRRLDAYRAATSPCGRSWSSDRTNPC